jgi:hypothetical protein
MFHPSLRPTHAGGPRVVKTLVPFSKGSIAVYSGTRVRQAFTEVTQDMNIYKGAKLGLLFQAIYEQGKKDGAREVNDLFERMMKTIPHKNPGQPRKK